MAERLQKLLAAAGIASRRSSEQLILDGAVAVNGTVVRELGCKVDRDTDRVTVNGRPVRLPSRRYYIAVHKPRGVISSVTDPHGRRTVTSLVDLQSKPMLRPVGRLDFDTEGLIFLTDDGDFLQALTHPRHEIGKTYRAIVEGRPSEDALARLRGGVLLADGMTAPAEDVRFVRWTPGESPAEPAPAAPDLPAAARSKGRPAAERGARPEPLRVDLPPTPRGPGQSTVEITIHEGRNRQVRRMFDAVGHPVARLTRIAIGGVRLSGLPPGAWRHLTPAEVAALTERAASGGQSKEKPKTWQTEASRSTPTKARSSPSSRKTPRRSPRRTS